LLNFLLLDPGEAALLRRVAMGISKPPEVVASRAAAH
jgi:hypothetical protein